MTLHRINCLYAGDLSTLHLTTKSPVDLEKTLDLSISYFSIGVTMQNNRLLKKINQTNEVFLTGCVITNVVLGVKIQNKM